ncbi:MAG: 16S rRNA (cytidine(1402)-2'-O)-methyltransferase [Gammaproteobacteria bacterium]|nr:16S rRNA (cytidine(1402)-2'-O)-methyltransferase [Sideroxydans sp.]MBU3903086.1 16S rRNA (cytidine(1402)-2'-O)-methyltransferase [Gammaproteobacteria bacterium]
MHSKTNQKIEHALYVVATPIGNLSDISLRALDILNGVNVVAAEDTRNSRHLLQHHGISDAKLLAVHQHNERGSADKVISLLQEGQSIALVTDAGTPAVSDPGAVLVEAVIAAGFRVIPIPGASAVVTALSASGLINPHFMFYGFLPNKSAARRVTLQSLANQTCTLAFYEAPHRILECTADLQAVFGDEREIVFAREITKLFESIHRCKLGVALDWLNSDPNNQRGEFVLLVSGAAERTEELDAEAERVLTLLLEELPLKQAVQLAVQITGQNKNALYQKALSIKSA